MRFKLLFWILFFVTGLNFVQATETRLSSMGGVGMFIKDNSNVFVYPSSINFYKEQVMAELRFKGQTNQYSIATFFPLGNSVIGFSLNTPLDIDIVNNDNWKDVSLNNTLDIFFGMPLSGFQFGANVKIAMDRYTGTENTYEYNESANYFALNAGLSSKDFDLSGTLELPSLGYEISSASDKWGGVGFGVNARYFLSTSNFKNITFVPTGTFFYRATSEDYDSGVSGSKLITTDYGYLRFAGGAGIQYQNKGGLFVLGIEALGYTSNSTKNEMGEQSNSTMILPGIYLGSEINVTSWLTARIGAKKIFAKETEINNPKGLSEVKDSSYKTSYNMTFGLGIHFHNFNLDAVFNEGLLFDGPNFISGSNNSLANRLSLTYTF